jgi:hypothetical protein
MFTAHSLRSFEAQRAQANYLFPNREMPIGKKSRPDGQDFVQLCC